MSSSSDELLEISRRLDPALQWKDNARIKKPIEAIIEAVTTVSKAWSGSNLGYHANVYYKNLAAPPPGAHFSIQHGLGHSMWASSTGEWLEYERDTVRGFIFDLAGNPSLDYANSLADKAEKLFDNEKSNVISLLTLEFTRSPDTFIKQILEDVQKLDIPTRSVLFKNMIPSGKLFTQDYVAAGQGFRSAPHQDVLVDMIILKFQFDRCKDLADAANKASLHLQRAERTIVGADSTPRHVFIGHGQSQAWTQLKDFIQDRLSLQWDEFNRVPVAGITNIDRLKEMLDATGIAFLVFTAEDILADGRQHARMNVIHEAGLFQGRLGFTKAIILLEDGCEEFSNIHGLGQIRFPSGNISAIFEEIRRVLEREGMI